MQENLLEGIAFPCIAPFLLVGGKGLQFYGLRRGRDTDWVVPEGDFHYLRKVVPEGYFKNAFGDEGVRWQEHEFYRSLFGLRYELLIIEARQSITISWQAGGALVSQGGGSALRHAQSEGLGGYMAAERVSR